MLMLFSIFILAIKDHDQVDYFSTIHLALGGEELAFCWSEMPPLFGPQDDLVSESDF